MFINLFLCAAPEGPAQGRVPFKKLGHFLLVQGKIDGFPESYNFVVDTGGIAALDRALAQRLALKQQGMMAKITTLDLGGFIIPNVFCTTAIDFSQFRRLGTPIHGMIGSNLMERFRVTFDFEASSVTLVEEAGREKHSPGEIRLPFRSHPVNSSPIVPFKIGGEILEGMVDTGQPYPLVLPLEYSEQFSGADLRGSIASKGVMIKWPRTRPERNLLARISGFELGSLKLENILCVFGEPPQPLSMPLLGTDFLSSFLTTIDYPNHELILVRRGDGSRIPDNLFSFGMNFNINDRDEVFIEGLWENSAADRAGLEVGEILLSWNGRSVGPDNLINLLLIMGNDAVAAVELEFRAPEGTKKVRLEKTFLFRD
jgi:hypothetical protein